LLVPGDEVQGLLGEKTSDALEVSPKYKGVEEWLAAQP